MNYIGNHHVHRTDQFTMAHSVEGRFPFLDHNVIEVAFKIPSCLKIIGQKQKYILRKIAKKHIAPECLQMKKKGFRMPIESWLYGPLRSVVIESLENLKKRPEIRSKTVSEYHNKFLSRKIRPSKIWHLVSLELWFCKYIDRSDYSILGFLEKR